MALWHTHGWLVFSENWWQNISTKMYNNRINYNFNQILLITFEMFVNDSNDKKIGVKRTRTHKKSRFLPLKN